MVKFFKYGLVGLSGVFVDFAFTWICKEIFKLNKYIANSIGFTVAASSNYILNRVWTFASKSEEIALEYSLFIGISIVGLLLNNYLIYILNDKFKLNFYLAKVFAIGAVTVWNFLANYFITFRGV
ncbi:MAG TPA: GtrA family protein [Bacteroidetes bacterium]|nr:GtrA family protein [Bacteroidota bacterium]